MKTIGILGGMSWQSSLEYYRLMNEEVSRRINGLHSAKILMHSCDFQEIADMMHAEDWEGVAKELIVNARSLEAGGADCVVIATNTMHSLAPEVAAAVGIPLVSLLDATGEAIRGCKFTRVGLLGTRFTMEKGFYPERLADYGIEVMVPDGPERSMVHKVIFTELCKGITTEASRNEYLRIIRHFAERGAQGVILGCTEIPLLVEQKDSPLPLFDTTALHARAAVDFAMG